MDNNSHMSVIDYLRFAARRFSERPALVGDAALSYSQLYLRVRRWAAQFASSGLEAGERVAIWLPKCPEYLVALYAAMEVGGVYVPLDGAQPAERAKKILASANPQVLVTDYAHLQELADLQLSSLRLIVVLDDPSHTLTVGKGAPAVISVATLDQSRAFVTPRYPASEDLAAILFTSGSTGTPKGVQISYGNLHCFLSWAQQEFSLSEHDVFANHAGFHFDLSTFDVFAAAASGGAIWIIPESEQRDVSGLLEGIRRYNVSVWYSVPSVLTLLVNREAFCSRSARSLRYVLFAGEVFPIKQLRTLRSLLSESCQLYNLYGPTETNVCLYHKVRPEDLLLERPVYIGRTLPGVEAAIVDSDGCPVAGDKQLGELVVSGSCVTPGYWQMEFSENRAYHRCRRHATGDLVSLENGLIRYHGRRDRMIKVQGNRVELGEIESAMERMPGLAEVAVVAEFEWGSDVIVAYFVAQSDEHAPTVIDIKTFCRDRLPRYMIPRRAHRLAELPRNANGKIDYRGLARTWAEDRRARVVNDADPVTARVKGATNA